MQPMDDKMRMALHLLTKSHQMIKTAVSELRTQSYVTEADNLQAALDTLQTRTDEAIAAVNLP